MAGRDFDAQVVLSPKNSPRGKLLSQYVCVRVTRMDDMDVALFDRDWNNTIYYFALNADEQIYLRYGGRDARAPDSYLNLNSLELALQQGLELHRQYKQGTLKKVERPQPLFPRQMPLLVERTFARNACVECHLIGDYQNVQREMDGKLDKLKDMYRSPDIQNLGIYLEVAKGLVVKEAQGVAATAGMKPGDRITQLNQTPVWTFGDLQYYYDKVPRSAQQIQLAVDRDGRSLQLSLALPARWWWTDLTFRQWSVEPRVYFESVPLTESEKLQQGLMANGFASKVKRVDSFAEIMKSHELRVGDIIFGVDGVERDDLANTADLFIKLRKKAGDTVTLDLIRDGKKMQMKLTSYRMSFRK
jgi:C-terminal processing protease CtpA/Prc